jgi:hypothetical protein
MNGHLTERQLIDYEFQLASEATTDQARRHLEQCADCRGRLEVLKRKLSALDLLGDDIRASEALVSRAVESAARAVRPRVLPLRQWPWLGTVAAVVVVGFMLLLVSNRGPQRRGGAPTSPTPFDWSQAPTETPEQSYAKVEQLAPTAKGSRAGYGAPTDPAPEPLSVAATRMVLDEIATKPPFAPASAIELVVLPRRQDVQLTIYNAADLTLVRERRNLTLKRGWNWLQFMWANTLIDPTSLSLEPLEHIDQVDIQQLVFPPRLRELGRWLIRSEVSGQVPFELTYFTSGLSWRAFYMGTLSRDETTMRLEGYVRVDNHSGEDYEDARTRLIVGRVHLLDEIRVLAQREYAYGSPIPAGGGGGRAAGLAGARDGEYKYSVTQEWAGQTLGRMVDSLERKEIIKEGLSEYFLYTIEGTETIPHQWGKRLLSFEADDIGVESLYKYDEQRWGDVAIRYLSFANDEEHELGVTPLPDGAVRIYGQADAEGLLSYVGATAVKYIPVGEEVELSLGPARLVEVKPTLMDFRTDNYVFDANDNIAGWDEVRTWKVAVSNARTLPVEIEVTRGFDTPYWVLSLGQKRVSYEKHDATHARFRLTLEAASKCAFHYTLTTYHGLREEVFVKRRQ